MDLVLATKRLRLTPLTGEDVDVAVEMFTNPAVVRYAGGLISEADIRQEFSTWTRRGGNGEIGIWCVADLISGEKFGSVFLLPIPIEQDDTAWLDVVPGRWPAGDIEVGFNLVERAWGKGYASEACSRIVRFAFEEASLDEVVATLDDRHAASKNVLDKCGFRLRGRRRAYAVDGPDYRLTRSEWLAMGFHAQGC
jgi:[ribosomal protein S5]-alanine N-acetyltransferase